MNHARAGGPNGSYLQFSDQFARILQYLHPRDMIDIQSFLWVQGSDEYEEAKREPPPETSFCRLIAKGYEGCQANVFLHIISVAPTPQLLEGASPELHHLQRIQEQREVERGKNPSPANFQRHAISSSPGTTPFPPRLSNVNPRALSVYKKGVSGEQTT